MGRVQQIIEFSQFSVVNAKFRRELWIYKIMKSVSDTHPLLIYVTISSVKEIRFWNKYPPTFYVDVTKYAFFFDGFPKPLSLTLIYNRNHFGTWLQKKINQNSTRSPEQTTFVLWKLYPFLPKDNLSYCQYFLLFKTIGLNCLSPLQ